MLVLVAVGVVIDVASAVMLPRGIVTLAESSRGGCRSGAVEGRLARNPPEAAASADP
jgi:hypothetical protein